MTRVSKNSTVPSRPIGLYGFVLTPSTLVCEQYAYNTLKSWIKTLFGNVSLKKLTNKRLSKNQGQLKYFTSPCEKRCVLIWSTTEDLKIIKRKFRKQKMKENGTPTIQPWNEISKGQNPPWDNSCELTSNSEAENRKRMQMCDTMKEHRLTDFYQIHDAFLEKMLGHYCI